MNIVNWFFCSFSQSLYLYLFCYLFLYLFNLMFIFSTRTAGVCPSDTLLNIAQQMLSLASSSATKRNVIFKLKSFCLHKYVIHSHMNERTHTHATAPLNTHTVGSPTAAPVTKASKQTATRTTKQQSTCKCAYLAGHSLSADVLFLSFSRIFHFPHTTYTQAHTHTSPVHLFFSFFC